MGELRQNERLPDRARPLPLGISTMVRCEGDAMQRSYQHLDYREQDGVFCVRIRNHRLQESGLDELSAELARLIDEGNCRKLVLSLGPDDFDCLYSVFLAKLVNL